MIILTLKVCVCSGWFIEDSKGGSRALGTLVSLACCISPLLGGSGGINTNFGFSIDAKVLVGEIESS